ncbi:MAG: FprA family A-type flavoprotein [Clostridiales bacterium]|nr:FprA family A-type flavoprotein [Clostridiales bacterium]
MQCTRQIAPDIYWVGGSDRRLALFENLFPLPDGVAYNSYLIADEKTALMDTVDTSITRQFLEGVEAALNGRGLDFVVVNHMEPDHCAHLEELARRYPQMKIVGNPKTFQMIRQFYTMECEDRFYQVGEGDTLSLGRHTLRFTFTPMVHWPEVMMTYDTAEHILFSADAFGSFGAHEGHLFSDEVDFDTRRLPEARRYYANIVGKYGPQVQAALKKLSGVDIRMICPLHGPVWRRDLPYLLDKYDHWSRYQPEKPGVVLSYASMYGNTENAVTLLADRLAEKGVPNLRVYDVSKTHPSYIIGELFQLSHAVFGAPTYNGGMHLAMENLFHDMASLNLQNRKVALIGNGSWAPASAALMKKRLEGMKNMTLIGQPLEIRSSLKQEQADELEALANAIASSVKETRI